jgi:hypothetical protein
LLALNRVEVVFFGPWDFRALMRLAAIFFSVVLLPPYGLGFQLPVCQEYHFLRKELSAEKYATVRFSGI